MIIFKEFDFDAAHLLPNVPENHKCKNLHGHTYTLKIFIKGDIDKHTGWVMDFAELKKIWGALENEIDHKYLNNIKGLENPTVEILAMWIWTHLKPNLPELHKIELYETPTSGVIYKG